MIVLLHGKTKMPIPKGERLILWIDTRGDWRLRRAHKGGGRAYGSPNVEVIEEITEYRALVKPIFAGPPSQYTAEPER